ncbi:hypothetical protein HYT01_03350 [Candidatus Giovannonibacteria bacterium]|nr:hypothetical protein [Candidatus Giovannonibacteria bacterium]
MRTKQTGQQNEVAAERPLQHSEILALSLIFYAEKNVDFKETLKALILSRPMHFTSGEKIGAALKGDMNILMPGDAHLALRRAEWLINELEEGKMSGSENARDMLLSYASAVPETSEFQPAPIKNLVVGVIRIAIPGITMGRWKMKKEKPMMIVVRKGFAMRNSDLRSAGADLAHYITQAAMGIIVCAFDMAGGNAQNLEPDTGDWFFGQRPMGFYVAKTDENLAAMIEELKVLGITHTVVEDIFGTEVVAISPIVNNFYLALRWELKPFVE